MVVWSLVLKRLNEVIQTCTFTDLKAALIYLYAERGLSTKQITELLGGECCRFTLQMKMKELGIPLRGRGGPNNMRKALGA